MSYDQKQMVATILLWIVVLAILILGRKKPLISVPVALVIFIGAGIAIPSMPDKERARRQACQSELKAIQGAKEYWAKEFNKLPTDTPTIAELKGMGFKGGATCPIGGTFTIGSISELPRCSLANEGHTFPQ